ncbi:hypothetical protein [Vreelandella zhaodongensis]|uniref:HEPN AbiU2-like domain-containing protein n=1 Tax=Vreelandella zhaodongensis TaxID=1176240 RepID=A0ABX2SS85_VREZH|nr:hypothetical protein [Halomonas zhaodongensis]NYS44915.1 hypothetical protein [Halomonas zhaodongensis]
MENWLRTDELEESVSALRMMRDTALKVANDVYQWKWIVIASHNALQGFMVLALRNGNNLTVMPDKLAGKWLEAYRADKPLPEERLDSFPNLYKKIKGEDMERLVMSRCFTATAEQDRCVKKLQELRNDFIHFIPKGWSIEVSGLPSLCLAIIEIIEFLGWESFNVLWHNEGQREEAEAIITELKVTLDAINDQYQKSS